MERNLLVVCMTMKRQHMIWFGTNAFFISWCCCGHFHKIVPTTCLVDSSHAKFDRMYKTPASSKNKEIVIVYLAYLLSSSPFWGISWVYNADTGSDDVGPRRSFCCRGIGMSSFFSPNVWKSSCSLKRRRQTFMNDNADFNSRQYMLQQQFLQKYLEIPHKNLL